MKGNQSRWSILAVSSCLLLGCGSADEPCGPFPNAPEGYSTSIYVDGSCASSGSADGSMTHPYATVSQALAKASDGAAILLAPGVYAEDVEIKQGIALVGSSAPADASQAAATIEPKSARGFHVHTAKNVLLRGIRIAKARGAGLWVEAAEATVEGSIVEGTALPLADEKLMRNSVDAGSGIVTTDQGLIIIQHSMVSSAVGVGVSVLQSRAIIIQNEIVKNGSATATTTPGQSGEFGGGIRIDLGDGESRIENNHVDSNVSVGIGVFSSRAIIIQNTVENTSVDREQRGDGIVVGGTVDIPADVTLGDVDAMAPRNVITKNARAGILCGGGARGIIIQNNDITQNAQGADFGAGIWMQGGAGGGPGNTIQGNKISANRFLGLGMVGDTHAIIIQKNLIEWTEAAMTNSFDLKNTKVLVGDGLFFAAGASASVLDNDVKGNGRFGLMMDEAGASGTTSIESNRFSDHEQYAIIIQNQPNAPPTDTNTFSGNKLGNVSSVPAGTYGRRVETLKSASP